MDEYEGHWITIYTGKKFHYLDPQPEEVDIVDIAHHLSFLCRFTGACSQFYSVAEHSIRVSDIVPENLKLSALLHDAAETYIGDISRPVKHSHKLHKTEKIIMDVIAEKYGINPYAPEIKRADNILLATETRDLMPSSDSWSSLPLPLPDRIEPYMPEIAEAKFLDIFYNAVKEDIK